ncbi:MAG: 50S ribosomal protein L32 [Planctomycetota bacterium]|nr:50S ribosomal protein L32 [Planctomycetota bacterium]
MPNPKRRHSVSRKGMRRAHDHLAPVQVGECPRCGSPKRPHRVCLNCGYYRGRDVLRFEASGGANEGA